MWPGAIALQGYPPAKHWGRVAQLHVQNSLKGPAGGHQRLAPAQLVGQRFQLLSTPSRCTLSRNMLEATRLSLHLLPWHHSSQPFPTEMLD
jgi:hypothetical protein